MDIEGILKEFQSLKARRAPWEQLWELIARYMFQRKQGFSGTDSVGDFFTPEDVFDNTAGLALQSMVSSMDGALWKNGARTFRVRKPYGVRDSREIKEFYEKVNQRIIPEIEHEQACFGTARLEALAEGGAFGTDAIGVFASPPDSGHKLEFKSMSLKNLYIVEDSRGRVIKEFYEQSFDAFQLVQEYGEQAKTEKVLALITKGDRDTKLKVIWCVRPNAGYKRGGEGLTRFSYESIHILESEKLLLRHRGYSGNCIIVSRFYKNEGEEYGRCPGAYALSPAVQLNALVEMVQNGTELAILPSWYVLDDGTFGNGKIDRSAGGVVPIDVTSSRISGMAPIGMIGSVGDMNPALKLIEFFRTQINAHFFVDRLTDLNNQTRMTLGEAQIRNELRADNVGSIFSRQIEEKITPVLRRAITLLDESGDLGIEPQTEQEAKALARNEKPLYIPEELLELRRRGIEIYQLEYISPAARILRAEELRGVISVWQFAAGFAGVRPEMVRRLDDTKSMDLIADLYGAPNELLISTDDYDQEKQAMAQAQQAASQAQAAQIAADVQAKSASAAQQNAQAQATVSGMNGLTNGGGAGYQSMIT